MMECPHCHEEIPGKACPQCGAVVPEPSRFCMDCGARFEVKETPETTEPGDPFDLENRVLCPDGTCTGVIVNGTCSECGRSYEEALAAQEGEGEAPDTEETR